MKQMTWTLVFLLGLAAGGSRPAQAGQASRKPLLAQAGKVGPQDSSGKQIVILDPQREKHALQVLLKLGEKVIVSAADAMPADKYGFAPTDGEFKGVRTFGQMVKHLSAANDILAAAALGEDPPAGAGDEMGPDPVQTKADILDYLTESFAHLRKAVDAIGQANVAVKPSPISPLKSSEATRLALVVEALLHDFDHYGQMVEYLRMNGVVPPASRP